jgi:uncharacterized protein YoaH (UPF0181 family)
MKAYRISIGTLVLFTLFIVSPTGDVLGQCVGGHNGKGFFAGLTEEQREAVQEKVKEIRSQSAAREEIHAAVAELLKGYGIEPPEKPEGLNKPMGFGPGGFLDKLTDEQREAVREKIKEMRSRGVTRQEIHAAVAETLKGYGIELPEKIDGRHGFKGFGHSGFLNKLTDEQREAVRGKIKEMRSQGATREEIRATVAEMLEGYGIKLPKDSEGSSSETAPVEPYIQTQNFPNPFNPQTEIAYSLPGDCYVKLTIYNIQGQKVKQLVDEYQSAGTKKVVWDGCDESGEEVASGIYFYRIEAGPNTETNRMALLK